MKEKEKLMVEITDGYIISIREFDKECAKEYINNDINLEEYERDLRLLKLEILGRKKNGKI
ncbi:MAG: hypothetical protein ACTSXD_13550 [Candidatus Heimdallarchaeaceae archaeon]